jgi:2-C-methyl-D-erythritol 4-phosphate cytidylyltransferase
MPFNNREDITLIIPAAGKSSRFPAMRPKWMLTHPDGNMMIEKVLKEFEYESYKNTYVIILREHCDKFEADLVLEQAFGSSVSVIILEQETSSCPETVLRAIEVADLKGRIIIKDTDCLVTTESIINNNFVVGMKIDERSTVKKIQNKSFIVKNDDNLIQDIVEKSIVSDNICLGVYCLTAEQFIESYNEIINSGMLFNNRELYISHIISHLLINKKVAFQFVDAKNYVDWGTLKEWQEERSKFNTYIFDIDGVMLINYGKYGSKNWSNTLEPIKENFDLVKELSDQGHEIIFMTSRTKEYLEFFKAFLKENNIQYKTIISGCNHGRRIIVNDFASTNPYPSCSSISIERNGNLKTYLFKGER